MYLHSTAALLDDRDAVEAQAQEAFDIARSLCGSCRPYHSIWPYLRLTGRKRGVDADGALLIPLLSRIIAGGARRIFLAGSADPGILSLVLAAAGTHAVSVTILDLCPTPLETCRSFAARRGVAIRTETGCLSRMTSDGDYDLVIAHSVLSFIGPALLPAVVGNLARALVPDGRLVVTSGLSARKPKLDDRAFCDDVLAGLFARGVVLPTTEDEFRGLVTRYAAGKRQRLNPFESAGNLVHFVAAHGLEVTTLIPQARGTSVEASGKVIERTNPGVILVARKAEEAGKEHRR